MYDMKNLGKLSQLDAAAPEAMKAFWEFDKQAFAAGALSVKIKELIAIAVATTTQCPYCISIHTKRARENGATDQEIAEAVLVSAAIRAGGAITHGTHTVG